MKQITVVPLLSALGITLGCTRKETYEKLGKPDSTWEQIDHFNKGKPIFSIEYNSQNNVEYIEITNPNENGIIILFKDIDVFGTPATELIKMIEETTDLRYDRNHPEADYSFIFPTAELSFWRPTIPTTENDEDGKYFKTIGIGNKGYFCEG